MGQRLFQRGTEVNGRGHAAGRYAEGFRELDEIWIDQIGGHHPAVETLALVAPHIGIGVVLEVSFSTNVACWLTCKVPTASSNV
jgi:hypothetical protein